MTARKRLDVLLYEKGWAPSRQAARTMITAGRVLVNRLPVDKPGRQISPSDEIAVRGDDLPYVSRGGLKIEEALRAFQVDAKDLVCMDVGASTGGFTDCLLQHGAGHVFAVDVGYGQMAWKLRTDPRVTVIERTNIRYLPRDKIPRLIDLAVIDVSFISLKIVIPAVLKFLKSDGRIIALIKPQFEVGKGKVGKGGVVKDTALHREVIESLEFFCRDLGMGTISVTPSPIKGPKGNLEFLIYLKL